MSRRKTKFSGLLTAKDVMTLIHKNGTKKVGGKDVIVPRRIHNIERNAACPCGSGKKYKRCCGKDVIGQQIRAATDRMENERMLGKFLRDESEKRKGERGLVVSNDEAEFILRNKNVFTDHIKVDFRLTTPDEAEGEFWTIIEEEKMQDGKFNFSRIEITYPKLDKEKDIQLITETNDAFVLVLDHHSRRNGVIPESDVTDVAETPILEGELIQ